VPKISDEKQQERRDHILEAAETCFARSGFHRTTMNDICREARISAGALYLYFDSKEALNEGIVARDRDEFLASFAAIAGDGDLFTGLASLMDECVVNRPPHKIALFLEIGIEATRNPVVAKTLTHCDAIISASLAELLERAKSAGQINPSVPVSEAVNAMSVIADGLFWRSGTMPGFDVAAAGKTVLLMIAALLRPQPSTDVLSTDVHAASGGTLKEIIQ
jgi:TetR/AcrR family transcriptional repressor of uid operon